MSEYFYEYTKRTDKEKPWQYWCYQRNVLNKIYKEVGDMFCIRSFLGLPHYKIQYIQGDLL